MIVTIFLVFIIGSLVLIARFLYKSWWYPVSLQYLMNSQGIRGPPYKFLNWNARETTDIAMKLTNVPGELSHDIFPRVLPHFYSGINTYGRNFLYWMNAQPLLVVTDVDLIKEILSNKQGSFGKIQLQGLLKKFLGDGIVFQEGPKWSKLRRVADRCFHAQSLKDMIPAMVTSVEAMLKKWKSYNGKEIEVFEQFRLLSLEIISRSVFGSDFMAGKQIYHMLDEIVLLCSMTYAKNRNIFTKSSAEMEAYKVIQDVCDSLMEIIKQREDKVQTGQSDSFGDDFLGSLLKGHHSNIDQQTRISLNEIIEECKTFYFAGHETVRSLLSWSILVLAVHTDWQDKARKEVFEILGQENPKAETISRLKIVDMIINETLRLYPPVVFIQRMVTRKTRLGELKLPAGIEVIIPNLAVHHNNEIWGDDAHLFKPQRFGEGVSKAIRDQMMGFQPFGFGLRKCVGYSFANMEAKIALSMILQRYKFSVSPNYIHYPIENFGLRPKHGTQIILHPLQFIFKR